jgi:hypothetical protein
MASSFSATLTSPARTTSSRYRAVAPSSSTSLNSPTTVEDVSDDNEDTEAPLPPLNPEVVEDDDNGSPDPHTKKTTKEAKV